MIPKHKLVLIEWVDSMGSPGWHASHELKTMTVCTCQTAGFIVDEDMDSYVVALSCTVDEGARPFADLIAIPRIAVKKIVDLHCPLDESDPGYGE